MNERVALKSRWVNEDNDILYVFETGSGKLFGATLDSYFKHIKLWVEADFYYDDEVYVVYSEDDRKTEYEIHVLDYIEILQYIYNDLKEMGLYDENN